MRGQKVQLPVFCFAPRLAEQAVQRLGLPLFHDAQLWAMVPQEIRSEYAAYSTFFEKYRENKVAETTEKINNTYIEDHGQPAGTKSYGLVVDLTVAYYKAEAAKAQAAE